MQPVASWELVTDGLENMKCGAVQTVGRVVGAACASAEERYKGQLNSEAHHRLDITKLFTKRTKIRSDMSSQELDRLLMGMDLNDQHIHLFREKAVDMDTFLILTEEDLIEIGIEDPDVREHILNGINNLNFKKATKQNKKFGVLDATKIMLSSTNHLDTLYNLLKYVQLRLRDQPVINQFLYDQYSASEGAEEMTKLLLQRVERLHDELQGLQDDINQFNTQYNNSCYHPYGKECEYGSSTLHIYTGVRQAILTFKLDCPGEALPKSYTEIVQQWPLGHEILENRAVKVEARNRIHTSVVQNLLELGPEIAMPVPSSQANTTSRGGRSFAIPTRLSYPQKSLDDARESPRKHLGVAQKRQENLYDQTNRHTYIKWVTNCGSISQLPNWTAGTSPEATGSPPVNKVRKKGVGTTHVPQNYHFRIKLGLEESLAEDDVIFGTEDYAISNRAPLVIEECKYLQTVSHDVVAIPGPNTDTSPSLSTTVANIASVFRSLAWHSLT
uniref:SAM domain-containing protein n=1 Tax=Timema shepardi TaxID=629360 RepID=A0A7R9G3P2_TIMSH|nr:unnamed protein product [Timema shepardi]